MNICTHPDDVQITSKKQDSSGVFYYDAGSIKCPPQAHATDMYAASPRS